MFVHSTVTASASTAAAVIIDFTTGSSTAAKSKFVVSPHHCWDVTSIPLRPNSSAIRLETSAVYGVTNPRRRIPYARHAASTASVDVVAGTCAAPANRSRNLTSRSTPSQDPDVPAQATTSTRASVSRRAAASMLATSNWSSECPSSPMRVTPMRVKCAEPWPITSADTAGSMAVFDEGLMNPNRTAVLTTKAPPPSAEPPIWDPKNDRGVAAAGCQWMGPEPCPQVRAPSKACLSWSDARRTWVHLERGRQFWDPKCNPDVSQETLIRSWRNHAATLAAPRV